MPTLRFSASPFSFSLSTYRSLPHCPISMVSIGICISPLYRVLLLRGKGTKLLNIKELFFRKKLLSFFQCEKHGKGRLLFHSVVKVCVNNPHVCVNYFHVLCPCNIGFLPYYKPDRKTCIILFYINLINVFFIFIDK